LSGIRRRLERLEGVRREGAEDEHEREKRLKAIRETAEQENERFYRHLAIERRTAYLENIGYEGFTSEDLRDENFFTEDDVSPFTITESGEVFSTRDGKPVTSRQVHAELYYWEYHDEGYSPRGLIHDEETQGYYMPDPPHELAFSRDRCYLQRWMWALGWETSDPYFWSVPERLETPDTRRDTSARPKRKRALSKP